MAGYLDNYGADDERREERNRWLFIVGAAALVLLFFWFVLFVWDKTEILRVESVARLPQILRKHKQEDRVKQFLAVLRQDPKAAYAMWGCTDAKPCKEYPFTEFSKDWGPDSQRNPQTSAIVKSRSCGNGVIVTVDSGR